jgi:protein TonB
MSKKRNPATIWIISTSIALGVIILFGVAVKVLLMNTDDQKRNVHKVVLLKPPPPPPPPKEKPPEPEVKEEIIEEKLEELPDMEEVSDDLPEGSELGIDAEGTAGGDAFGLRAKKGRALVGSDDGGKKFLWYTTKVSSEIQKLVNDIMRKNDSLPKKELQARVRVVLNDSGRVVEYRIVDSSGSRSMDMAIESALQTAVINEPPPLGMPKALWFRVKSQG